MVGLGFFSKSRTASVLVFFFSSRRRHTRLQGDWSSDVCSSDLDGDKWYAPAPLLSIDSRGGCGPVWSPDGTKMAAIYEGVLHVWPVAVSGEPLGPPRRVTNESSHSPSWQGDSRHILYQSLDKLRIVDVETGDTRTIPLDLKWTPAVPTTHVVIHAGKLVDMKSS